MTEQYHRQPLLNRLRRLSLQLLRSADTSGGVFRVEPKLPSNFLEDLTLCLDAPDSTQLEPCLSALARVTFAQRTSDQHSRDDDFAVYVLWRKLHLKRDTSPPETSQLIEASLLKAASRIITCRTAPELLRRSVTEDTLSIVLRRYIRTDRTPPSEFLDRLKKARPMADTELVDLAGLLLECGDGRTWPYLVAVYPKLLQLLLVLNFGDEAFLERLSVACDRWPRLGDLVLTFADTISEEKVKNLIFGKLLDGRLGGNVLDVVEIMDVQMSS